MLQTMPLPLCPEIKPWRILRRILTKGTLKGLNATLQRRKKSIA
jgi:hypothetical protein